LCSLSASALARRVAFTPGSCSFPENHLLLVSLDDHLKSGQRTGRD
jgi:hypothetical protein